MRVSRRNRETTSQQRPLGRVQYTPEEYGRVGRKKKARNEQVNRDENGTLLRYRVGTRERWVRFFDKLLNAKSLKLDPITIELLPPRPLEASLGDEPSMDEMMEVIKGMPNWKAVEDQRPPGRPSKSRSPRVHPCQCLDNGRSPAAMERCDHQGPSQKEGSL